MKEIVKSHRIKKEALKNIGNEVRPFFTSESIYIISLSLRPDYRDIPHLTSHITSSACNSR